MITYNCDNCENDFRAQEKQMLKLIEDMRKTIEKIKEQVEEMKACQ